MPTSAYTDYLIKVVLKDQDWMIFTQLMYDKIYSLAAKAEVDIMIMNTHHPQLQNEMKLEVAVAFSKLQKHNEKQNSM